MVAGGETDQDELKEQLRITMKAVQRAVVRLLKDDEAHPQLVLLALARVTGETGAAAALASGENPAAVLDELAEVVRQAGREFHEVVQAEAMPTAGNA